MIKVEIKESVAWVKIDRPKQKNALSIQLLELLLEHLKQLENNNLVSVIVIFGEVDFSAGGDINDMLVNNHKEALFIANKVQQLFLDIENISKPIIAYTKGLVLGGGLELALVCDIIVSHSNAQFSLPETALGIIPGGGATQRLKNAIGKQNASIILMTGMIFSANQMLRFNLIQDIFDDVKFVEKLAKTIAKNNNVATKEIKKLLKKNNDFKAESESFANLLVGEGKQGIKKFLNYKK